jgi:glycosyltransferase involved in cell wall biosynthesis
MPSICFVRTDFGLLTGATIATLALAEELRAADFDVHLLSIFKQVPKFEALVDSHIKHTYMNPLGTRQRHAFLRTTLKLRRYLIDNHIDIVCSVCMSPTVMTLLASAGTGLKTVFIEHSNRSNRIDYGKADDRMLRMTAARFDRVVVLTHAEVENYTLMFKVERDRLRVIPNWIGDEALHRAVPYDAKRKRLITVGRPSKVKGFEMLVQVAALLKDEFKDWEWNIYGDGELFHEVSEWIREAGVEDFVFLRGNDPDVLGRYGEHSIFVMTSYFEGLPLSLLEARANHLPAVAFDCPTGPCELIEDGKDGFLISCFDIYAMASKLAALMRDEGLRERFAMSSGKQIEAFSKDAIFGQWRTLIKELL